MDGGRVWRGAQAGEVVVVIVVVVVVVVVVVSAQGMGASFCGTGDVVR